MSRSSVRLPAALRSRRARFAAPAVVGAVALSALAVPAYAAAPPAAKPKVIATVDVGVSAKGVAVSQETGDAYVTSGGQVLVISG